MLCYFRLAAADDGRAITPSVPTVGVNILTFPTVTEGLWPSQTITANGFEKQNAVEKVFAILGSVVAFTVPFIIYFLTRRRDSRQKSGEPNASQDTRQDQGNVGESRGQASRPRQSTWGIRSPVYKATLPKNVPKCKTIARTTSSLLSIRGMTKVFYRLISRHHIFEGFSVIYHTHHFTMRYNNRRIIPIL